MGCLPKKKKVVATATASLSSTPVFVSKKKTSSSSRGKKKSRSQLLKSPTSSSKMKGSKSESKLSIDKELSLSSTSRVMKSRSSHESQSTSASSKSKKSTKSSKSKTSSSSTGSRSNKMSSYSQEPDGVPPTPHSPNTYYSYYEYYTEREAFTAAAPTSHKSQALLHLHRYPLPAQTDQARWKGGTAFASFRPDGMKSIGSCANFVNERSFPDKGPCKKEDWLTTRRVSPRLLKKSVSGSPSTKDEIVVAEHVSEDKSGSASKSGSSSSKKEVKAVAETFVPSEVSYFDERMQYPYGKYRAVLRPEDDVDYRTKYKLLQAATRDGTIDRDLLPTMSFTKGLQQVTSPYGIATDLHEYFHIENPHEDAPQNPQPKPHQQLYTTAMRMVRDKAKNNEENKEANRLLEITGVAVL